jgi:hypothetical protein
MTCVVGCVDKRGRVWLGGDASVNGSNAIEASTDPKVWRSGGVLLGAAGDWTSLDLLRRIDCPPQPDEQWIRYGIPAAFRQLRRELGVDPPAADGTGFEILVAARGALWWASDELAMVRMGRYCAIGSGCELALGVLCDRAGKLGRLALERALSAAAKHCQSVCPPFSVVSA